MEKICPECYAKGADVDDLTPTEAHEKYGSAAAAQSQSDAKIEDIVAEVTRRVLEQYKK